MKLRRAGSSGAFFTRSGSTFRMPRSCRGSSRYAWARNRLASSGEPARSTMLSRQPRPSRAGSSEAAIRKRRRAARASGSSRALGQPSGIIPVRGRLLRPERFEAFRADRLMNHPDRGPVDRASSFAFAPPDEPGRMTTFASSSRTRKPPTRSPEFSSTTTGQTVVGRAGISRKTARRLRGSATSRLAPGEEGEFVEDHQRWCSWMVKRTCSPCLKT